MTSLLFVSLVAVVVIMPAARGATSAAGALRQQAAPSATEALTEGSLESAILGLRAEGKYVEAGESARALLTLLRADPGANRFDVEYAEELVRTLEHVTSLPEQQQRRLAAADSLVLFVQQCWEDGRFVDITPALERQLEVRAEILGEVHPEVAGSLVDLALFLQMLGETAQLAATVARASDVHSRLHQRDHPATCLVLCTRASLSAMAGSLDSADSLALEALAMSRELLGEVKPHAVQCLGFLGSFAAMRGDQAGSEILWREAVAIARDLPEDRVLHGSHCFRRLMGERALALLPSLMGLGSALVARGDFEGAAPLHREAAQIVRGRFGDGHPFAAATLLTLAESYTAQGDYQQAEVLLKAALPCIRRSFGEDALAVPAVLSQLAGVLRARGDLAGAEWRLRSALGELRKRVGLRHTFVAKLQFDLATLLMEQGDYSEAEGLLREAADAYRASFGDAHVMVAACLTQLANVKAHQGDPEGAALLADEGLKVYLEAPGGDDEFAVSALRALAAAHRVQDDPSAVHRVLSETLDAARERWGEDHPITAQILMMLAVLVAARGEHVEAASALQDAVRILRSTVGEGHALVAMGLHALGMVARERGDYTEAGARLVEACRAYGAARLRVGPGLERATFLLTSPFPYLAATRLRLGNGEGAWQAAEQDQGRVLADLLIGAGQRGLSPGEAARSDSLRHALGDLERRLDVYSEARRTDSTAAAAALAEDARTELLKVQAEWGAFRSGMAAEHPVTEGQAFPIERVQSALPDAAALIGWVDVDSPTNWLDDERETWPHESWAYVVRPSGPVAWARVDLSEESADATSVYGRMRSFRSTLATPEAPRLEVVRSARALWNERIRPVLPLLDGVNELIVVPSGPTLGVPIEAFVDSAGTFVEDRFAVSYAPSATIFTWLAERGADRAGDRGRSVLVLADPPLDEPDTAVDAGDEARVSRRAAPDTRAALAGNRDALRALPRLPGTRAEAAAIAELCPGASVRLGAEATEQLLTRLSESGELASFRVLHVATHALIDDEEPLRSALVLSQSDLPDPLEAAITGSRIYDGLVTAQEVLREWRLDADVVTLSACETGLGREVGGEGYIGLAHAFLQAGARSLLVSLWKVEDRATSLLMRRFYENWLGPDSGGERGSETGAMTKADALQEARRWLRDYVDDYGNRPYDHPYYWSAFILIGDPS